METPHSNSCNLGPLKKCITTKYTMQSAKAANGLRFYLPGETNI